MARWAQDASERRGSGCSPGQRQDHGQADAARGCRAGAGVRQSRCPFSAPNFGKGNNLGRGLSDGEENPKHSPELVLWEMGGATPRSGLAADGAAHARSAFQSKEVRILTSEPVVVSEGCGQVPGLLPHHLEAPQVRTT